jgi:hypothetical protein
MALPPHLQYRDPWRSDSESEEIEAATHESSVHDSYDDDDVEDATVDQQEQLISDSQLPTAFSTLNISQEPTFPSSTPFAQSSEIQFPPAVGEEVTQQQSTAQEQTYRMENIPYRFGLGPHAETYSGLPGENLKRWIISTTFLLEAYPEWTGTQQVRAVYPLLRLHAKDWFHTVMGTPDEPEDWEELAHQLTQVFRTEQHMYRYEESLDKIKQSKFANLEQYFATFQALANELNDMPKRHLVYKFAKGLTNADARHAILNTPGCTLQRAYEIASSRIIGDRIANPNTAINYDDGGVAPMDLDAFIAQGRNNAAAQNRNDIICWNCNQPGHLARTCRRRRNRQQQQPQQQQPQQQRNRDRRQGQFRNMDAITDEEWQMILRYRELRNGNPGNGNDNAGPQENLQGQ